MSETTAVKRPPEPDFSAITTEELITYRAAENGWRASGAARAILGEPDRGAAIEWQNVALPGRDLPVRVYRPVSMGDSVAPAHTDLPLVVHVHGGGFVGTAVQCDWTNSRLAARLPALVVSVEHRLVAPDSSLANAADDGWDVPPR
ncbi:alpha/beta hydrolase [Nonomuraea dietziae]|uniref:alpha/beta hydrolase n=1 Tax=Nonomuraea dietziae TaxID=65515 RepID=UPI0033D0F2CA